VEFILLKIVDGELARALSVLLRLVVKSCRSEVVDLMFCSGIIRAVLDF
jgi:hypothetical protein